MHYHITAVLVSLLACLTSSRNTRRASVSIQNVEATYTQLQTWYDSSSGLWQDTWWNSASCLATIENLGKFDKHVKENVESVVANTYAQAPKTYPGYISKYYDDDSWWAMAWIGAFDLTSNETYLSTAQSMFDNTIDSTFGKTDCSELVPGKVGGIWWDTDHTYVNSIPNELFLQVAASLANRIKDTNKVQEYVKLAKEQWAWFESTGLIDKGALVNDGLMHDCSLNNTIWTYNQGVILGGLIELRKADPSSDGEYLNTAHDIAQAANFKLTKNGILREACESWPGGCNSDRTQFKGIFVRNLVKLMHADPSKSAQYKPFIETNAESVWANDRSGQGDLGVHWAGPYIPGNASTTCSGLDLLIAAVAVQ